MLRHRIEIEISNQRSKLIVHPVAVSDEVVGEWKRLDAGAHHPNVAGSLASQSGRVKPSA